MFVPPKVFHFKNEFFKYEGGWRDRGPAPFTKEGAAKLYLDNAYIEANFEDGEIHGEGVRIRQGERSALANRTMHDEPLFAFYDGIEVYKGQFYRGEAEGFGLFEKHLIFDQENREAYERMLENLEAQKPKVLEETVEEFVEMPLEKYLAATALGDALPSDSKLYGLNADRQKSERQGGSLRQGGERSKEGSGLRAASTNMSGTFNSILATQNTIGGNDTLGAGGSNTLGRNDTNLLDTSMGSNGLGASMLAVSTKTVIGSTNVADMSLIQEDEGNSEADATSIKENDPGQKESTSQKEESEFPPQGDHSHKAGGDGEGSPVGESFPSGGSNGDASLSQLDGQLDDTPKKKDASEASKEAAKYKALRDMRVKEFLGSLGSNVTYSRYEGMWHENRFHGEGFLSTNQLEYRGQFEQHKFHGDGRWKSKVNDERYIGQFVGNQYEGDGLQRSGIKCGLGGGTLSYIGQFQGGIRSGKGIGKCNESGLTFNGEWVENEPVTLSTKLAVLNLDGSNVVKHANEPIPDDAPEDYDIGPEEPVHLHSDSLPVKWLLSSLNDENTVVRQEGGRNVLVYLVHELFEEEEEAGIALTDPSRRLHEVNGTIESGDMELAWTVLPTSGTYHLYVEDLSPDETTSTTCFKKLPSITFMLNIENTAVEEPEA